MMAKAMDRQQQLPYGASEGTHAERLALLRQLVPVCGLNLAERELMIWIANVEHKNDQPLRRDFKGLGEPKQGLACSAATAWRIVKRLRDLELIRSDAPNEYRIDWEGVRKALAIPSSEGEEPFQNEMDSGDIPFQNEMAHFNLKQKPFQNEKHTTYLSQYFPPDRSGTGRVKIPLEEKHWPSVQEEAKAICRALGQPRRGRERDNALLAFRIASLKVLLEDQTTLADLADSVKQAIAAAASGFEPPKEGQPPKPIVNRAAWLQGAMVTRCKDEGLDFHRFAKSIEIPAWAQLAADRADSRKDPQEALR